MKRPSPLPTMRSIACFILLICINASFAQVGIGTVSPDTDAALDVVSTDKGALLPRVNLTQTTNASPLSAHVAGMLVYNEATVNDVLPGYYFNSGSKWVKVEDASPVDSVTLTSDISITSLYNTYTNVSGMSLTFTARKPNVLVMMTASGFAFTTSLGGVYLRVRNTTGGTTVGGTMTKMQSIEPFFGSSVTTWSCSFTKLMTGLTVGSTYTLQVQGAVTNVLGTTGAFIRPATTPDAEHLTLSVIQ